jgi:hypothetical protein
VKNTRLSVEVLCIVGGTYLERDLPGPAENPDLLRRYLEQSPYEGLSDEAYVKLMEDAVQLWPDSRFARAGLARAILRGHSERTMAEKRRAAPEYLRAAEIAFAEGKVRYIRDPWRFSESYATAMPSTDTSLARGRWCASKNSTR